jgi:hypothetical protein
LANKWVDESTNTALLKIFHAPGCELELVASSNSSNLPIGGAEPSTKLSTTRHHLPVFVSRLAVEDKNPITKGLIYELV